PADDRERVGNCGDDRGCPRSDVGLHCISCPRRQAAPSSSGMSAVAAKASDPVSRTMGFRAAFLVMGRLGNAQVTHVNATIASTKRNNAYPDRRHAPVEAAAAIA